MGYAAVWVRRDPFHACTMDQKITLRPITADDMAFLQRVYASTREDELAQVDWTEAQKASFLRMQFEAQHKYYQANYAAARFQIIMADDRPIGRLYVIRWPQEIRIIDIALLPEYRGRGIGSAFLRDILADGQRRGLPVTIHVERFNPALRLYERLGFHILQDKGVYYLMEWSPASTPAKGRTHGNSKSGKKRQQTRQKNSA
jgi:ribosomal protein S18 acetylase RimI-like enzyme